MMLDNQPDCFSGGSRISRRGGVDLVGGTWTPEAVTFRRFWMSKQESGPLTL